MVSDSVLKVTLKVGGDKNLADALTSDLSLNKPLSGMAIYQWRSRNSVPSRYIQSLVKIGDGCVSISDFFPVNE